MLQNSKDRGSPEKASQNQISKTNGSKAQNLPGRSKDTYTPYKNALGKIKRFSLNNDGEDDFSTPKPIKTVKQIFKLQQPSKKGTSKKPTKKKTSNSILKRTKDNFKNLDVNPEHLQVALAMSKSTFAQEQPERENEDREQDLPSFLSPQTIPKVTTFLEKYGFKSNKNHLYPELSIDHLEEAKKRKNSKFRFITPTLYTRTKEDRESLINSKVSLLITQNKNIIKQNPKTSEKINSTELEKFISNNKCWNINRNEYENAYILSPLKLSPSKPTVGCLLKRWEQIPGREISPQRSLTQLHEVTEKTTFTSDKLSENIQNTETVTSDDVTENLIYANDFQINKKRLCSSPDLFDDADDSYYNESPKTTAERKDEGFSKKAETSFSYMNDIVDHFENETYSCTSSKCETDVSKRASKSSSNQQFLDSGSPNRTPDKFEPSFTDLFNTNKEISQMVIEESPCISATKTKLFQNSKSSNRIRKTAITDCSEKYNTAEEVTEALKEKSSKLCFDSVTSKSTQKITDGGSSNKVESFIETVSTVKQNNATVERKSYSPTKSKSRNASKSSPNKILFGSLKKFDSSSDISLKINEEISIKSKYLKYDNETLKIPFSKTKSFDGIECNDKGIEYFESFYDQIESNETDVKRDLYVDLTQSSDDDEQANRDCALEKCAQIEEMHPEEATSKNFDQPSNIRFSTKRSSVDSGHISLDYNHTKSLNVTDYVLDILNSQEDMENQEEALTQSQSTCSQESIEIVSDEELNYSSRFSAQCKNANFYDLENFDDCIGANFEDEDVNTVHSNLKNKYGIYKETSDKIDDNNVNTKNETFINNSPVDNEQMLLNLDTEENLEVSTPKQIKPAAAEDVPQTFFNYDTPSNNLIIKTSNVTPMANYDGMDTPKIREQLDKFGIKPLKRRRGIELLKYIYESTHPIVGVEFENTGIEEKPVKKRKLDEAFKSNPDRIKIVGTELIQNENETDLLFERKNSKKILSCRIPLQIAWYNFLSCNPGLKENILLYEPIHLEVVHSMFKEQSGCNFHIEELITFLDKKCITFRTIQGQGQRKKQEKTKS